MFEDTTTTARMVGSVDHLAIGLWSMQFQLISPSHGQSTKRAQYYGRHGTHLRAIDGPCRVGLPQCRRSLKTNVNGMTSDPLPPAHRRKPTRAVELPLRFRH